MPVIIGGIFLAGATFLGLREARKAAVPIIGVMLLAGALFLLTTRAR